MSGPDPPDFVLLPQPRRRLDPTSLERMVTALREDQRLGAVGPRIMDEDSRLVWSQRRFPRLRSTYARALFLQRAAPHASWSDELIRDRDAYERPGSPDWLSGACLCCAAPRSGPWVDWMRGSSSIPRRPTSSCGYGRRDGASLRAGGRRVSRGRRLRPFHVTTRIWAQSRVRYARKHHGRLAAALEALGVALEAATHAAVWAYRPRRARAYAAAGVAALGALRTRM